MMMVQRGKVFPAAEQDNGAQTLAKKKEGQTVSPSLWSTRAGVRCCVMSVWPVDWWLVKRFFLAWTGFLIRSLLYEKRLLRSSVSWCWKVKHRLYPVFLIILLLTDWINHHCSYSIYLPLTEIWRKMLQDDAEYPDALKI